MDDVTAGMGMKTCGPLTLIASIEHMHELMQRADDLSVRLVRERYSPDGVSRALLDDISAFLTKAYGIGVGTLNANKRPH